MNLTQKIIAAHRIDGDMAPGKEIALRIDHALLQDATGTMVCQQFESFDIPRVRTKVCVIYVDHNILQTGYHNPDDHLYLQSFAAKYGATFSRAGNGISHFAHLERYDTPGETMIGSDSHTCTAGAVGMLAIGAGGAEVAAAMAGEPFYVKMPSVLRVVLQGTMPDWCSAKDVILELLRRLTVRGGVNKVVEYVGPGVARFGVYERSTICNMTQELGATSGLFPSDDRTRHFLKAQGRESDWKPLSADPGADYDETVEIDLSALEPLIAKPHSPDNVVPVREVAGTPVRQVAVGSSVNSSYRDLMVVAKVLEGRHIATGLHVTLSPGSRQILLNILRTGAFTELMRAGVRGLEVACGPCIGMGAAPPTGGHSVRTFNRNFRGRSGTPEDSVWLCSPEVAAATALAGSIADPRTLGDPPVVQEPERYEVYTEGFIQPPPEGTRVEIVRGPNIVPPPPVDPFGERVQGQVLLKLGDNLSTDDILPGGNEVLPLRSNIPAIAEYMFLYVDRTFPARARAAGGGFIVAGENYGQGSSREHAAIAPMYLGVRLVLANSFARIHQSNLVNFGIPPLQFRDPDDLSRIQAGDVLETNTLRSDLEAEKPVTLRNVTRGRDFQVTYDLTPRQLEMLLAGGLASYLKGKRTPRTGSGPGRKPAP